ncbi:MAG TPA: hypothetical protein VEM76_03930 [Anaeromyxobacteraceae bacterium]|nr:hypothetical protein [Anaeromyxobacteraceae bacterium]
MKTHVRILFAVAALALAVGWFGLRRGNAALAARLSESTAPATRGAP